MARDNGFGWYGVLLLAVVAVLVAMCIAAGAVGPRARGAPVPFGPAKPPPIVQQGAFVMTWRGVDAPTYFRERGNYVCHWQGRDWYGVWSCKDGVLTVEEWPSDTIGLSRVEWSVKLASPMHGRMVDTGLGGSEWKLRPKKGRVD